MNDVPVINHPLMLKINRKTAKAHIFNEKERIYPFH